MAKTFEDVFHVRITGLALPTWLKARVLYHCELIELCARELEARGLLESDIPTLAAEALRRWAGGSANVADRAAWALKGALDASRSTERALNAPTVALLGLVREAVRVRLEGERASRTPSQVYKALRRRTMGRPAGGNIGVRGCWSDSTAQALLVSVGVDLPRAERLVKPAPWVLRDDKDLSAALRMRREAEANAQKLLAAVGAQGATG